MLQLILLACNIPALRDKIPFAGAELDLMTICGSVCRSFHNVLQKEAMRRPQPSGTRSVILQHQGPFSCTKLGALFNECQQTHKHTPKPRQKLLALTTKLTQIDCASVTRKAKVEHQLEPVAVRDDA